MDMDYRIVRIFGLPPFVFIQWTNVCLIIDLNCQNFNDNAGDNKL